MKIGGGVLLHLLPIGWDHWVLHGQVQGGLWASQGRSAPAQVLPWVPMGACRTQGLEGDRDGAAGANGRAAGAEIRHTELHHGLARFGAEDADLQNLEIPCWATGTSPPWLP